ncbi:MAG: MFS transporter [Cyanophyceae cyanobacterium]
MRIFLTVWFGQVISLLGSKLTEFALGVWVYQKTGSITQFALTVLLIYLPNVLISPVAGALVDRWNRRWAMMLSDSVAGISTLAIFALVYWDRLELWHVYVAITVSSIFNAFQLPAYTAATTQLVPKRHLSRANGMVQISKATAKLTAPLLAGFLIKLIALEGILLLDVGSFVFALTTLLAVRFPRTRHKRSRAVKASHLLRETLSSWHYISKRPGLVKLLTFIAVTYFTVGTLEVLFWPFVLNMASSTELGLVLSIGGSGMLFGSLVMSAWGGPKRRVYAILSFVPLQGVLVFLSGASSSLMMAGVGVFGYLFAQPIIVSCNQAIWQSKVPVSLQGRVFAVQVMLERSLSIVAYVLVGPLVDRVLEPMMAADGLLATSIGVFIGVGPGRGISLLLCLLGIFNIVATAIAAQEPRLRRVEEEVPDAAASVLVSHRQYS